LQELNLPDLTDTGEAKRKHIVSKEEFERSTVEMVIHSGKPIVQIGRELGVKRSQSACLWGTVAWLIAYSLLTPRPYIPRCHPINPGTVTASVILRKLAAYPRQNGLALALRELGKLERTFFTLQWLQDSELRRRSHVGLNKGEQQNALRRAVFFHRLGEIRDRSYENQRHRASGLNLLVAAIILWNTTYLQRAVDHLRKLGHHPAPGDLTHLSPLGWEHINLTGDYHWDTSPTLGPDQFRPLRTRAHDFAAAA